MDDICIRCWGNRPATAMKPSPIGAGLVECRDRVACDAEAMREARSHYCRNISWPEATQTQILDKCQTIEELAVAWFPLAADGKTDGIGGAEWQHALDHMHWLAAHEWTPPANPRSILDEFKVDYLSLMATPARCTCGASTAAGGGMASAHLDWCPVAKEIG